MVLKTPVKKLMNDIFSRLKLKEKPFRTFESASDEDIEALRKETHKVDSTFTTTDTTQAKIKSKEQLQAFLKRHCRQRHYTFSVKKCEELDCNVSSFPRLPSHIFQDLYHLPDPVPRGEHYEAYDDICGTGTSEEHRPSLKENKQKSHGMPFSPTVQ